MKTFLSAVAGYILATTVATVRGDCDELRAISLPLTGDATVSLSSNNHSCIIVQEDPDEDLVLEDFIIEGGTLTLTGPSTTTFANLRFTVMDGAGLIFAFDQTNFGPNFGYARQDSFDEFMLDVLAGGYAEFSGDMFATEVGTYYSVFRNNGTLEFKSNAHFYKCGTNVFRSNYGKLRFRADATFEGNIYLGIENDGGTVRIAGESVFNDTGISFDGADGAAFSNRDGGIAIFDGFAVFEDSKSDENGGAVYNAGKMKFYNKARFFDNFAGGDGGAVSNTGDLRFFGAVQMIGNIADNGGGLHAGNGGSVIFRRWTTIQDNEARETGGAMSITDGDSGGSTVELGKPTKVRITGNIASESGCSNIYLEDNSELIGYESDGDICIES